MSTENESYSSVYGNQNNKGNEEKCVKPGIGPWSPGYRPDALPLGP